MSDDEYGLGDDDFGDALVAAASAVESKWTETQQRRASQQPAAAPVRPAPIANARPSFTGFGGRGGRSTTPAPPPAARPPPPVARPHVPPLSTFDLAPPDLELDEESGAYKLPKPAAVSRPTSAALAARPAPVPVPVVAAGDLRAKYDALQRIHAQQERQVAALQREKERKDGESANIRRKWEDDQAGWKLKESELSAELAKAQALVSELTRLNHKRDSEAVTLDSFRKQEMESAAVKRRLRNTGATASQRPPASTMVPPLTVSPRRRPPTDASQQQLIASTSRPRSLVDDTPAVSTSAKGKGRAKVNGRASPVRSGSFAAETTPADGYSSPGHAADDSDDDALLSAPYDLTKEIVAALFRHEVPPWQDPGGMPALRTPTIHSLINHRFVRPSTMAEAEHVELVQSFQSLSRALFLSLRLQSSSMSDADPVVSSIGQSLLDMLAVLDRLDDLEPLVTLIRLIAYLVHLFVPFGRYFLRRKRGEPEDAPPRLLAIVGGLVARWADKASTVPIRERMVALDAALEVVECLAAEEDDVFLIELAEGLNLTGLALRLLSSDLPRHMLIRMLGVVNTLVGHPTLFRAVIHMRPVDGIDAGPAGRHPSQLALIDRLAFLLIVSNDRVHSPLDQAAIHLAALTVLHGLVLAHDDAIKLLTGCTMFVARLIHRIGGDVGKLWDDDGSGFRGPKRLDVRSVLQRLTMSVRLLYYFAEAAHSDVNLVDLVHRCGLFLVGTVEQFTSAFLRLCSADLPEWLTDAERKILDDLYDPATHLLEEFEVMQFDVDDSQKTESEPEDAMRVG